MQVCTACTTTTDATGRFCPECGAALAAAAADAYATAATDHGDHGDHGGAQGSARVSAAASLVGLAVDGFAIEAVLGGGSFATVYRGRQVGLDREIALKVPTHEIAADPIMARRFAREARAASCVNHPGVVAIYAVGDLPDGRPYLAMQLINGEPLDRILADGPVHPVRALEIARQVATALAETHAADVVHRDLKPSNIVWRRDRHGDDRIVIVDFGIAVCKPGTADATRLTAGGLIGTPHYMSPEQAHGDQVDARADLYALGCILYELLTAQTPFSGSGFEVLLAHLGRPPPLPSRVNADVPEAVDQLVVALMAKKPEARPQSAEELVALIDDALDHLGAPKPRATRDRPAVRRPSLVAPTPDLSAIALPDPPRRGRARYFAVGAATALALTAAGVGAARLLDKSGGGPADGAATEPATKRRELPLYEDGDTRLRVWVPDPMRLRGGGHRVFFELRNKLGQLMRAETVVVTIEDPNRKATGVIARPRQAEPNQFGFHYTYPVAGTYHLRIFPPETASVFDVSIDVEP